MRLAVPKRVQVRFVAVERAPAALASLEQHGDTALVLLENCTDAVRLLELGVDMESLNVGNMHYGQGKRQICTHVAASSEDLDCLRLLRRQGVPLDFRCVPEDVPTLEDW